MSGKNIILKDKQGNQVFPATTAEQVVWNDRLNLRQAIAEKLGAPWAASTVSSMTDKTRIYVYTGDESGYTKGNWYYWDGSAWVSGGVYNSTAVDTDKTLSVSGKAADGEVVGQKIDELKSDLGKLSEEIANKTGTGLSTEAIDKLEEVGNYLAYTTADGGSKWTELISILRNVELSNSADLWEVGGIQPQGTGSTSTTRLRTIATLSDDVKKISVDDGYSYILVVYSEAQTEVPTDTNTVLLTGKGYYNPNGISGNVSTDSFLVSSGTYFNGELLISEVRANINSIYGSTAGDRAHFRILLKNNDDTTLTADDGLHIHLWG